MPDMPTGDPEQFYQAAPLLLVPDVLTTAGYYRRVLGFRSDAAGSTPEYTVVWRDNAAVHLARGERAPSGVRVFFWVKDVNGLHDDVLGRGAEIEIPLEGLRPVDMLAGGMRFDLRVSRGDTVHDSREFRMPALARDLDRRDLLDFMVALARDPR